MFKGEGFDPVMFNAGEAVVVPAAVENFELQAQWQIEFLRMHIPPSGVAQLSGIVSAQECVAEERKRGV